MIRSGVLLLGVVLGTSPHSANLLAAEVPFNARIRPILAEHCLECHGPDANKREADLRLDLEASAKEIAITSERPEECELYTRITSDDNELRMPPPETGKRLTPEEIQIIRAWIEAGAKYEGHWSYQPVVKPSVPAIAPEMPTDIDRFLVEELRMRGLDFSPPIHRRQWIRRATLDLIGIPPTWEEVDAFLADPSPDAEARVIDRLLASPRYGERWGRHWLDIARYADTLGGSAIGFQRFPFSYTYRDYVIQAFNKDLPYDRFLVEQIAADQLGLEPHDAALAGLGFLTVGMQFRNRHDLIDDQIDVVTRGLLGLTVACARCHDHKFDAIPTADYYSLYAVFAASAPPDRLPLIGEPPSDQPYADYQATLKASQTYVDDLAREQSEVMRGRLRMQVGMYLSELAKGTPEQDISTSFLSYRTDDLRPLVLNRWRDYLARLPDEDPVFGLWRRLSRLSGENFAAQAAEIVKSLVAENGPAVDPAEMRRLEAVAPKWNPRVLEAFAARPPESLVAAAEIYGEVFGEAHQAWLNALRSASLEAKPGGEVIPDEDPRHVDVNGSIHRQLRRHLYAAETPTALPDSIASQLLNRTVEDNLTGRKTAIHELDLTAAGSPPRAMVVVETQHDREDHVFRRGNPLDRGPAVQPRFLTAISTEACRPFPPGKRRLALAQAIVAPENPLTRRVIVNWVWQHHFGQGLVRTPDDFGTRGIPPTHPRLLDYLAEVFREEGWSIKKLHRQIMLSAAYRQAAMENESARSVDPENMLLWRMPRRRLDLEAMRDSMLAASAELDTTMGGRPIDLTANPAIPRRSVYGFVNRDIVSSLSSTFDGANPNACTAKRPDTSVPQQTLFALNSEFIQDRALKLAELSETSTGDDVERVQWLIRRVYSRDPEDAEIQAALDYVRAGPPDSKRWPQLAHVLLAANEFVFVD